MMFRWAAVLGLVGLAACGKWDGDPVVFSYNDNSWEMRWEERDLIGNWLNAPAGVGESRVRYEAVQAFEAYAGCPMLPNSMQIDAREVRAVSAC